MSAAGIKIWKWMSKKKKIKKTEKLHQTLVKTILSAAGVKIWKWMSKKKKNKTEKLHQTLVKISLKFTFC